MTEIVYSGVALLIAWALLRRPQAICVAMAAAFLAAVGAAEIASGGNLRPILMGIDALVVMAMWFLWWKHHSERAALVATLCFLKIWLGISAAAVGMTWNAWAAANNAIFIIQVLVAGGFIDGIVAWLGRRYSGAVHRGARLLGHLE